MRHFKLFLTAALLSLTLFASCGFAAEKPVQDEDHFYLIASASELAWFRDRVNAGHAEINARLTQNIDLGGRPWTPIGDQRKHAFNGVFDGSGFYARGLYVPGKRAFTGLFGFIGYGGMVQSLSIEGAHVLSCGASSDVQAGILAGVNYGVIQDCAVMRSSLSVEDAEGTPVTLSVGALTGRNDEGIILNSSSFQCNISVKMRYSPRNLAVGGIAGMNVGTLPGMGLIQNCGALDNRIAMEARAHDSNAYAGGVLGLALSGMARRCSVMQGTIDNNYFMGSDAALGGIIGSSMLGSYLENCAAGGNLKLTALGGAAKSAVGGIAGSLVGSNVEGCEVDGVFVQGTGSLPHSLGGLVGAFAGGRISNCMVRAAELPNDPQASYRVGAVAGVTFEVEIVDTKPQTLIENTYFEEGIAGGRAVGSDGSPENTNAIPFAKDDAPAYSIDVPSISESAQD